jgi:hypothetical protein
MTTVVIDEVHYEGPAKLGWTWAVKPASRSGRLHVVEIAELAVGVRS